MDRALVRKDDLALVRAELAELLPPESEPVYRCQSSSCRWEGPDPAGLFNDLRRRDETRCPVCGTWIGDGMPLMRSERSVVGDATPTAPRLVRRQELIIDDREDG